MLRGLRLDSLRSSCLQTKVCRLLSQRVSSAICFYETVSLSSQRQRARPAPHQRVQTRGFAAPSVVSGKPGSVIPFMLADIGSKLILCSSFILFLGEGIAEVEVLKWHVKEGDHVEQFQKVCTWIHVWLLN